MRKLIEYVPVNATSLLRNGMAGIPRLPALLCSLRAKRVLPEALPSGCQIRPISPQKKYTHEGRHT